MSVNTEEGGGCWTIRDRAAAVGLVVGVAVVYWLLAGGDLDLFQRDSPEYLATAIHLAQGKGFTFPFGEPGLPTRGPVDATPLAFYPPGLPLLLAVPVALGADPQTSATLAQGGVIGVAAAAAYLGSLWVGLARIRAGVTAAVVVAAALSVEGILASEPFSLAVTIPALYLLASFRERPRGRLLIGLGGLAALGVSIRFAEVALVGLLVLVGLAAWSRRRISLLVVAAAGALGIAPAVAWLARNRLLGVSVRDLAWHPPSPADFNLGVASASGWLAPIQLPLYPRVGLGALAVAVLGWVAFRNTPRPAAWPGRRRIVAGVFAGYAVLHGLVLLVTVALLDGQTRFDGRQIAPIAMADVAGPDRLTRPPGEGSHRVGGGHRHRLGRVGHHRGPRRGGVRGGAVDVFARHGVRGRLSGGHSHLQQRTRRDLGGHRPLDLVDPPGDEPWTPEVNPELEHQLEQIRCHLAADDGFVIVFESIERDYLPSVDRLAAAGFRITRRLPDSVVLRADRPCPQKASAGSSISDPSSVSAAERRAATSGAT
ncbi:MAG: hypothetical protein KatS3mg011_0871 [Acidimicrobiia bacterium]|nr:MAG: hypothetical protein KatS3mg011_0871 [Acidimicrobiia bacterium]